MSHAAIIAENKKPDLRLDAKKLVQLTLSGENDVDGQHFNALDHQFEDIEKAVVREKRCLDEARAIRKDPNVKRAASAYTDLEDAAISYLRNKNAIQTISYIADRGCDAVMNPNALIRLLAFNNTDRFEERVSVGGVGYQSECMISHFVQTHKSELFNAAVRALAEASGITTNEAADRVNSYLQGQREEPLQYTGGRKK